MLAFFPEWDNINISFWNKHFSRAFSEDLATYKDIDL